MSGLDNYSRKRKLIVGVAMLGMATSFCELCWDVDGVAAQGCQLVVIAKWTALLVLHCIVLLADYCGVPTYLYDNAGLLQYLPKAVASLWPLLSVLVRQAC
jgi:hypothetical protein